MTRLNNLEDLDRTVALAWDVGLFHVRSISRSPDTIRLQQSHHADQQPPGLDSGAEHMHSYINPTK